MAQRAPLEIKSNSGLLDAENIFLIVKTVNNESSSESKFLQQINKGFCVSEADPVQLEELYNKIIEVCIDGDGDFDFYDLGIKEGYFVYLIKHAIALYDQQKKERLCRLHVNLALAYQYNHLREDKDWRAKKNEAANSALKFAKELKEQSQDTHFNKLAKLLYWDETLDPPSEFSGVCALERDLALQFFVLAVRFQVHKKAEIVMELSERKLWGLVKFAIKMHPNLLFTEEGQKISERLKTGLIYKSSFTQIVEFGGIKVFESKENHEAKSPEEHTNCKWIYKALLQSNKISEEEKNGDPLVEECREELRQFFMAATVIVNHKSTVPFFSDFMVTRKPDQEHPDGKFCVYLPDPVRLKMLSFLCEDIPDRILFFNFATRVAERQRLAPRVTADVVKLVTDKYCMRFPGNPSRREIAMIKTVLPLAIEEQFGCDDLDRTNRSLLRFTMGHFASRRRIHENKLYPTEDRLKTIFPAMNHAITQIVDLAIAEAKINLLDKQIHMIRVAVKAIFAREEFTALWANEELWSDYAKILTTQMVKEPTNELGKQSNSADKNPKKPYYEKIAEALLPFLEKQAMKRKDEDVRSLLRGLC